MSEQSTALAVTPQNHDEPAALQMARQTQMISTTATILDRANLQFFADMIEAADLIPYDKNVSKAVQKARVMSKIVSGVAHQFDPVSAQENLHVIQGRCVLSARGMSVKMARLGFSTRVKKLDDEGCVLDVVRETDGKLIFLGSVEFTYQQAVNAKLTTSNTTMYDKWRPDMLYANALKRAARRYCPQALDTTPVLYDTAKRPQPPTEPPPPNQIANPTPPAETIPQVTPSQANVETSVGDEYQEVEYSGPSADLEDAALDVLGDEGIIDAEPQEPETSTIDPEESESATALTYDEAFRLVEEGLKELGEKKSKAILKGRKYDQMDAKALVALLGEMENAD